MAETAQVALAAGDARSERLHAYLTQPMKVGQPFLARRAETVPLPALLDDVGPLLDGGYGEVAAEDLMFRGSLGS